MITTQTFNIALEVWGALFCFFALILVIINHQNVNNTRKTTICFEICGLLLMVADSLCRIYRGVPGIEAMYIVKICNCIVFIINYSYLALLTYHFNLLFFHKSGEKLPYKYYIGYIIPGVGVVSVIINNIFGFYYYIDDNNLYQRGDYYIVAQILAFVGLLIPFAILLMHKNKLGKSHFYILLCLFILPTIATVFTVLNYGGALQNISLVISTQIIFIYDQLCIRNSVNIALEKATLANHAKDRFIAHMSHDIRTPLNCIYGMLDLAAANPDDKELVENCHSKIRIASDQLLSSFDDVLMVSDIAALNFTPQNDSFDMLEIIENEKWIADVAKDVYSVNVSFKTEGLENLPKCYGEASFLQKVIIKLMDNALKFNKPSGSVIMSCKLEEKTDEWMTFLFTFEDTGIGIDSDFVKNIFQPFSQEDSETRTNYQGTGLGLVIVKKLVDLLEGSIEIESKKDVGTKVFVRLPFRIDNNIKEKEINEKEGKKLNFLIVEDNEINCLVLANVLDTLGMTYDTAENGQLALDKFTASVLWNYDVILMDIMMPVMDGIEATRAIRHLGRDDAKKVPIVMVTASMSEEDKRNAILEGATSYIHKPVDLEMIKNVVKSLDNKKVKD